MSKSLMGENVAATAAENGFVRTRWWWIRHAPVRVDEGRIYGQKDLPCDCSEVRVFDGLAAALPRNAVWVTSNLMRTHQTAAAIWTADAASKAEPIIVRIVFRIVYLPF